MASHAKRPSGNYHIKRPGRVPAWGYAALGLIAALAFALAVYAMVHK